jgi:hypothetical protein
MVAKKAGKPVPLPPLRPTTILFGCRPLVPIPDGAPCPVCGWNELDADGRVVAHHPGILPGHEQTICGACHAMSPENEARIAVGKAYRESLVEVVQEQRAENAEDRARRGAADEVVKRGIVLPETDRRKLWNGYQGGLAVEVPMKHATNRARVGRKFLTRIGQEPDWSLILDAKGRIVGCLEAEAAAVAVLA